MNLISSLWCLMKISRKFKLIAYWFYEPKLFFLAVLYLCLAFSWIVFFNYSEPSFRLIGLLLQIFGIVTVVLGIIQTREQFKHESYLKLFFNWVKRFPIKSKPVFIEPEGINVSMSIGDVILHTVFKLNPNTPIQEQLIKIEKEILFLQSQIDNQTDKNMNELNNVKSQLATEKNERTNSINQTLKIIESTSTGGIHISFIGTIWLLFGVIFSTASPELSKFLG